MFGWFAAGATHGRPRFVGVRDTREELNARGAPIVFMAGDVIWRLG
jgi:hypothetical protein